MALSNYPPGMNERDIPGNRPEDDWFDEVWNNMEEEVIDAANVDKHFRDVVDEDINSYSSSDDCPSYVGQRVSSRYLEIATKLLDKKWKRNKNQNSTQ